MISPLPISARDVFSASYGHKNTESSLTVLRRAGEEWDTCDQNQLTRQVKQLNLDIVRALGDLGRITDTTGIGKDTFKLVYTEVCRVAQAFIDRDEILPVFIWKMTLPARTGTSRFFTALEALWSSVLTNGRRARSLIVHSCGSDDTAQFAVDSGLECVPLGQNAVSYAGHDVRVRQKLPFPVNISASVRYGDFYDRAVVYAFDAGMGVKKSQHKR